MHSQDDYVGQDMVQIHADEKIEHKTRLSVRVAEMLCHACIDPHSLLSHTRLSDTLSLQSYLLAPMLH